MRLLAFLAIVLGLVAVPGVAAACGAFAGPPRQTDAELVAHLPYLTVEQVLVVWDKDTQTEDFVRETRFERAGEAFGFVVPMPSQPEVFGVKSAPFDRLRAKMPFESPSDGAMGKGGGGGAPMAAAAAPPTVEVLSQQRIGSFTAFTLATTNAGAFDKWLAENGFAMTKESKPWIEHYVRLKFFFVALRYEPSDAGGDGMTSETVRIRFKTPNPYYPYMEPDHAAGAPKQTSRMLSGWIVTPGPMLAVASRPSDRPRWGRPWTDGSTRYTKTSAELADILGPDLAAIVPKSSPLVVQPIRDQKISRAGFGDVVLVPEKAVTFTPADIDARKPLLGVVDPVLAGEEDQEPPPDTVPPPVSSAPKSTGCSATPGVSGACAWPIVAVFAAFFLRRRRALLALALPALVACRTPSPSPSDAAPAPVASASAKPTTEDRQQAALDILAGKTPSEGITPDRPGNRGTAGSAKLGPVLTIEGGLLPAARQVLTAQSARVRLCYMRAIEGDPNQHGELGVVLTVAGDGEVAEVQVPNEASFSTALVSCVKSTLKRVKFDAPNATLTVKAMYQLTAD